MRGTKLFLAVLLIAISFLGCNVKMNVTHVIPPPDSGILHVDVINNGVQNVDPGDQDVLIITFKFKVERHDITIDSIKAKLDGYNVSPEMTDLRNLKLLYDDGGNEVFINGPTNFSSHKVTFNNLNHLILIGEEVTFFIRANVGNTPSRGEYGLCISNEDYIVTSNTDDDINLINGNKNLEERLNVMYSANLNINLVSLGGAREIKAGNDNVEMLKYRFSTQDVDIPIKSAVFKLQGYGTSAPSYKDLEDLSFCLSIRGEFYPIDSKKNILPSTLMVEFTFDFTIETTTDFAILANVSMQATEGEYGLSLISIEPAYSGDTVIVNNYNNNLADRIKVSYTRRLKISVDERTPPSGMVLSGGDLQEITYAILVLEASPIEDLEVREIGIDVAVDNTGNAIMNAYLYLLNNPTKLALKGYSDIEGFIFQEISIIIPKGGKVYLEVKIKHKGAYAGYSGMNPQIVFNNLEDNWKKRIYPSSPDGIIDSQGGSIAVFGVDTSEQLMNTSDSNTDEIRGDNNYGDSANDTCGKGCHGKQPTYCQWISASKISLSYLPTNPSGYRGETSYRLWVISEFSIHSTGNIEVSPPHSSLVKSIAVILEGDAEADMIEIHDSNGNVYATSPCQHRTTREGGDPSNPADHQKIKTRHEFEMMVNIPFNSSKDFYLVARVFALTNNIYLVRELSVGIENFGDPHQAGDVVWYDNGSQSENAQSYRWAWVYDPPNQFLPPVTSTWTGDNWR